MPAPWFCSNCAADGRGRSPRCCTAAGRGPLPRMTAERGGRSCCRGCDGLVVVALIAAPARCVPVGFLRRRTIVRTPQFGMNRRRGDGRLWDSTDAAAPPLPGQRLRRHPRTVPPDQNEDRTRGHEARTHAHPRDHLPSAPAHMGSLCGGTPPQVPPPQPPGPMGSDTRRVSAERPTCRAARRGHRAGRGCAGENGVLPVEDPEPADAPADIGLPAEDDGHRRPRGPRARPRRRAREAAWPTSAVVPHEPHADNTTPT